MTGKKKRESIEFTKVQKRLLQEVTLKAQREFNETLQLIYEDLGIDMQELGKQGFVLRQNFTGIDFPDEPMPDIPIKGA